MSFKKYLSSLREQLKKGECKRFVLGNSGADYDSVIGAIVYAFYLTRTQKQLYLPLIDCPQADMPLRFQIIKVLTEMKIDYHQFLYTEMIPNLWTSNYTFVLHDHNTRTQLTQQHIYQITDHHAYDKNKIKCPHIINHCGSGLTLIYYIYYPELVQKFKDDPYFQLKEFYEKFEKFLEHRKKFGKYQEIDDQQTVDQLIYYGILIDTYGINQNMAHMYNDFDQYAVETLKKKIKPTLEYVEIGWAKYNPENNLKLTFEQQVKKDYKYLKYGSFFIHYSTVPLDIQLFKKTYWKDLNQTYPVNQMKQDQARVFMFSFPREKEDIVKAKFRKFIMFNSNDHEVKNIIAKVMHEMGFQKLSEKDGWETWIDNSGRISRKILDKEIRVRQQLMEVEQKTQ